MKKPSYILNIKAEEDLRQIWSFTDEKWGREQARKYLLTLKNRFDNLADNRDKGRDRSGLRSGYFSYLEGRHVIFYRKAKQGIEVMRVLHQNMDFQLHL